MLSLLCVCRQCALAALRDVKSYLTKEGGQIAVSLGVGGAGTSAFVGPSRTESYCRAALRVEGTSGPKRLLIHFRSLSCEGCWDVALSLTCAVGIWAPPLLCCFLPQQSGAIAWSFIVCNCLLVPPFPCCAGELREEIEEGALWRVRGLDTPSRGRDLGLISGHNRLNSLWFG